MIETDEQRRWWFANHPEYSSSRKGKRKHVSHDAHRGQEKVSPEAVDAYVDEALKYLSGLEAALLKSVKRHFGTEAEANRNKAKSAAFLAIDRGSYDRYGNSLGSTDELPPKSIEKYLRETNPAIESDPHTFLDVFPFRRLITAPLKTLQGILQNKAKDAIVHARKKAGNRPPPRLPPKGTPERRAIEAARTQGIRRKMAEERKNIEAGGKGSGKWTDKEVEAIRRGEGFPPDTVWHHDPTVANRPDLAADPRSVHVLRGGRKGHLRDGHNNNWRN